eukprot:Amastigsp_a176725_62.p2 type:complete len:218 gc:universal Amastigsp_a176725_62:694-41(-)
MLVICLEGCHGGGKSSLTQALQSEGWEVLDEAFLDMPHCALHPQSLTMEVSWMSFWFQRLLRMQKACTPRTVYFADRSPFSAVLYGSKGHLIEPLVRESIEELKACDIHVITVYLRTESELLWSRISERLEREPERRKYKEDQKSWMSDVVSWYEDRAGLWDLVIENNGTIGELRRDLLVKISETIPTFSAEESFALTPKGRTDATRICPTSPAKAE